MSAIQIIQDHDKWRRGLGGAPAGLANQADGNAYAGLDLNLITFDSCVFAGSSFVSTTFKDAVWGACQFNNCSFSHCDMQRIRMTACAFVNCSFSQSQLQASQFAACSFTGCTWTNLCFDAGRWSRVKLLECRGVRITGVDLQGEQVDFTGSRFEDMRLTNARIN